MAKPLEKTMSLEEFLVWEERQEERYEYDNGVITMMTGSRVAHDLVRGAVFASLFRQLRGKPCRPHMDVKIVCPSGAARYPDVSVDCGPLDNDARRQSQPSVVVEVLSPSTRSVDYLKKSRDYGSVPSIETYLIVDPDEPRVDVLRRVDGILDVEAQLTERADAIDLPSIGATLALADIYPPEAG
jgi:Uma2 family endonuclease